MATAKKRGDMYRIRYDVYDEKGKRHQRSVTAPTKKEAERLAALQMASTAKTEITFGEAVHRYIESKRNVLAPSTLTGYANIEKHHIGKLKPIRLSRITNELLQNQINEIAANYSPKTAKNARALFTPVLKMFLPDFQPHITVPKPIIKEKTLPTDEDIRNLLSFAAGRPEELPIKLAAFGSLRRAEISALFPDCIHEDHISIRRAFSQDPDNNWILQERPKSDAGYRDIYLDKDIMNQLHELVKAYPEEGHTFGIFNLNPVQIDSHFKTSRKRAGLSFRFHDLRHFFASSLHERGVPDQTIAKIGGWDDVATLHNIYQHSTKKAEESAALIMSNYYNNVTKNVTKES